MDANLFQQMRQIEDEHWWFVARRRILETLLATLDLPHRAAILELGCGTGGNFAMLNRFGTVIGVEKNTSAAEIARQRNVAPVEEGTLPQGLPAFTTQFDLITLFDVIEHIDDDLASLITLSVLLKPGGKLVITVPAFSFLWSRHDDENQHKRRYRRNDLKILANKAKLNLNYVSYFNTLLFPPVAAIRVFRKLLPYAEPWKDMRMPTPLLNRILEKIFRNEQHVIGKVSLPFGISLVAVLTARS